MTQQPPSVTYAQSVGQNTRPPSQQGLQPSLAPRSDLRRSSSPPSGSHPRATSHTTGQNEQSNNLNRANSGHQYNPYLRKKQKKNIIIDEGDEVIPFML